MSLTFGYASEGEKLQTLDDSEYELRSDDLVIADGSKAVALAGVMGGANSEVDENTTDVVLEQRTSSLEAFGVRRAVLAFIPILPIALSEVLTRMRW